MSKKNRIEPLQLFGWCVVAFGLYIWIPVLVGEPETTPGAAASEEVAASVADDRQPVVFVPVALTSGERTVERSSLAQTSVN